MKLPEMLYLQIHKDLAFVSIRNFVNNKIIVGRIDEDLVKMQTSPKLSEEVIDYFSDLGYAHVPELSREEAFDIKKEVFKRVNNETIK